MIEFIDPQLAIPDLLPEVFKVEVCYQLDVLATRMDTLTVTARERNKKLWGYELRQESGGVVEDFTPPTGGDPQPPIVNIREKNTDDDNKGE